MSGCWQETGDFTSSRHKKAGEPGSRVRCSRRVAKWRCSGVGSCAHAHQQASQLDQPMRLLRMQRSRRQKKRRTLSNLSTPYRRASKRACVRHEAGRLWARGVALHRRAQTIVLQAARRDSRRDLKDQTRRVFSKSRLNICVHVSRCACVRQQRCITSLVNVAGRGGVPPLQASTRVDPCNEAL